MDLTPLPLLAAGLWAAITLGTLEVAQNFRRRDTRRFGAGSLTLLSGLGLLSYLAGFTIGPLIAAAAIPLGLTLAALSAHFRRETLVVTLATALLNLATGGHRLFGLSSAGVRAAFGAAALVLALSAVAALHQTARTYRHGDRRFAAGSLGFAACLAVLSLLVASRPLPAAALGLIACLAAGLAARHSSHYRWQLTLLAFWSLLWALYAALVPAA